MKTTTFYINGKKIEFENDSQKTISGGTIETTRLYVDGTPQSTSTYFYSDLTFQVYEYQNAMIRAVADYKKYLEHKIKREFMRDNGYIVLTPPREVALTAIYEDNPDIRICTVLKHMLNR